jgi:excisionase family DNA binding protein
MNQIHSPGTMEHNPFTGRPINGRLLLTISEAAAALRISRSSIYRLFDGGELAWVQLGRLGGSLLPRFTASLQPTPKLRPNA